MISAMAHAILWTFIMMHFMSLRSDVCMKRNIVEVWAETMSQRKRWQPHSQGQKP